MVEVVAYGTAVIVVPDASPYQPGRGTANSTPSP
jgi:hypothetical protein